MGRQMQDVFFTDVSPSCQDAFQAKTDAGCAIPSLAPNDAPSLCWRAGGLCEDAKSSSQIFLRLVGMRSRRKLPTLLHLMMRLLFAGERAASVKVSGSGIFPPIQPLSCH